MNTQEKRASSAIQLQFDDPSKVVVEPADLDRFVMTASRAVQACSAAQIQDEASDAFHKLLSSIHSWCQEHKEEVSQCILSYSHDGLEIFVIVRDCNTHRFDLDDAITDFDIKVAQDFPQFPTEFMQMPENAVISTSFYNPSHSFQIYG